jgi:hypothetical protein
MGAGPDDRIALALAADFDWRHARTSRSHVWPLGRNTVTMFAFAAKVARLLAGSRRSFAARKGGSF